MQYRSDNVGDADAAEYIVVATPFGDASKTRSFLFKKYLPFHVYEIFEFRGPSEYKDAVLPV